MPRWHHPDAEGCLFLGYQEYRGKQVDVYILPASPEWPWVTWIARFGPAPHEYYSRSGT